MWGLGAQSVDASSSSIEKLSSSGTGEGVFDQLYHPGGRSIDSSSEVNGLRQLFSPGHSQMSLVNPVVNSLYGGGGGIGVGNHFPSSSLPSSSTSLPVSSHRSPDGSTLIGGYPITGTAIGGTATERSDALLDGYMLGGGSIGGVIGGPGGLMPPSSTNDQMIRSYHCRLCKQEFENKSDMQNHSKELHRTEEKTHKCIHCLKSFPTSQQLGQHSLVHSNLRKYPCAYCDKAFKQLSHVQQHQRIHTGERPYKCIVDGCTKAFRQLSSLQQHLKGHNLPLTKSYLPHCTSSSLSPVVSSGSELTPAGSKFKKTALPRPHDLTCQVCEKRCGDDELFFQHIHKHHPDFWRVLSGGLPLSDFVEPPELRTTSAKAKKFTCPVCNKRYAHETGYAKHLVSHPNHSGTTPDASGGSQLYNCSVCRKMFTKDVHLHRHLEMKTDPGHCAALVELRKKTGFGTTFGIPGGLATSSDDIMCPTIMDPDSSSKSRSFRLHGQGSYPLMRNGSLDGNPVSDTAAEAFMQATAAAAASRRYKYGREAEGAVGSSIHLGPTSCLSPRNSNSGSSTPDAFAYMRPFGGTSGPHPPPPPAFGDPYRKDCDAFRSYPFAFGSHLNQDFVGHSRGPYAAQNFFCQRPTGVDTDHRRHSPPDSSRHSYFPSSYLPHSQSGQGPLHGVISQPPFVHPSVETARFDGSSAAGGLLDPYLPRNSFSDHDMATALHQLARSIPGFI